jgi:hypothetical protein
MGNRDTGTTVALAEPSAMETASERLLDAPAAVGPNDTEARHGLLCTGTIAAVDSNGTVRVAVAGRSAPLHARALAVISTSDLGKDVILGFEGGILERPIVIGVLGASPFEDTDDAAEITISSERLTFEGKTQVVIRCGPTSITLTESGKVLIKGEYVSSRATGTNRIRGGAVQIN